MSTPIEYFVHPESLTCTKLPANEHATTRRNTPSRLRLWMLRLIGRHAAPQRHIKPDRYERN